MNLGESRIVNRMTSLTGGDKLVKDIFYTSLRTFHGRCVAVVEEKSRSEGENLSVDMALASVSYEAPCGTGQ